MSRLPTLEDLAKRMVPNAAVAASSASVGGASASGTGLPASTRPRLPQSILSGRAQANASPTSGPSNVSPPSPPSSDHAEGDKTGSLDEPPKDIPKDKIYRGYKNVPSLDAITERLRARTITTPDPPSSALSNLSLLDSAPAAEEDKSAPEGNTVPSPSDAPDTTTPSVSTSDLHPLQHPWSLFHDSRSRGPPSTIDAGQSNFPVGGSAHSNMYAAGLTVVGEFETVEDFCRYFNWLKPPSQLEMNSNYHLFKSGIKPMWEDPANANGGKWVLTMKSNPQLLDRCWSWLAMGLVGEQIDDRNEICGAVVSLRPKIDRIQLWTRSKDDVERINAIGKKIVKLLDIANEPGIGFEFQYHSDDRPARSRFISIVPSSGGGGGVFHRAGTSPSGFASGPDGSSGSGGHDGGMTPGWRGGGGGNAFGFGRGSSREFGNSGPEAPRGGGSSHLRGPSVA